MLVKKTAHLRVRDTSGDLRDVTLEFTDDGVYITPENSPRGWPIKIGFSSGSPTVTLFGDEGENPTDLIDLVKEQYEKDLIKDAEERQLELPMELPKDDDDD